MIRYKPTAERHFGFLHNTGVWMVVIMALITLHVIEVVWWGLYYRLQGYFPDYSKALLLLGGQLYRYGVRRRAAPARIEIDRRR